MTTRNTSKPISVHRRHRAVDKKVRPRESQATRDKLKQQLAELAESIIESADVVGRIDIHGRVLTIVLASFVTAIFNGNTALVFCFATIWMAVIIWLDKARLA